MTDEKKQTEEAPIKVPAELEKAIKQEAKEDDPGKEDQVESKVVELQQLRTRVVEIPLWGSSSLIMHKWASKAKEEILAKQMHKPAPEKQPKNPEEDVMGALHTDAYGFPVFPSCAFKNSAVNAAKAMGRFKTELRQAFHVDGDTVPILGPKWEAREDMCRIGKGTADIRYRPEFKVWGTVLPITYNRALMSLEVLLALFQNAGFGIGVGEWRPEKNGSYGRYEIATDENLAQLIAWRDERLRLIAEAESNLAENVA